MIKVIRFPEILWNVDYGMELQETISNKPSGKIDICPKKQMFMNCKKINM